MKISRKIHTIKILFICLFSFATVFTQICYAQNSVLASGTWYKVKLRQDGVYKITYDELTEMGINLSTVNPKNIRIYGNGEGILAEKNSDTKTLQLLENAIQVYGEEDGSFGSQDFILFYGSSPHRWEYVNVFRPFQHIYNVYDEYSYYFINTDLGLGKRIENLTEIQEEANVTVNSFADRQFHELDELNLISSGRTYYGEVFDLNTKHDFSFYFPNRIADKEIKLAIDIAARSSITSGFQINANNSPILSFSVSGINFSTTYAAHARKSFKQQSFTALGDQIDISVNYLKSNSASIAWLNYIELTAWRELRLNDGQLLFRNYEIIGVNNISEFLISNADSDNIFWEITDPLNVRNIGVQISESSASFKIRTDSLIEFVAFKVSNTNNVEFVAQIENQNYSGLEPSDLIIISAEDFLSQAHRLGLHHEQQDGLSFMVIEPSLLYNEFSSGAKDISAIRNFIKFMYDKADTDKKPRYVLLFGDASYDYKDRIINNTDFVPTWQSPNAVDLRISYMSDDYFGLLDDEEGYQLEGDLEVGIGRLPVTTTQEAQTVVDKIINYSSYEEDYLGDWRSKICLIGDDQDYNAYVNDSEELASFLEQNYPNVNIDKIYFDAYPQESTPGGQRYPEVKKAINENIQKGVLIVNYIGHGGEAGWAHERVLEISDINSWSNSKNLAVFITATCEFTRFDNPSQKSAGEYVLTNPNGGGIALFTTTRATSGGANFNLNQKVIKYIYKKSGSQNRSLGDILKLAKNEIGNSVNSQKFVLIGDPALKIALPKDSIATLKINNHNISITPDTIKALSRVNIKGSIYNNDGGKLSTYEGKLYPTVFDKPANYRTLGQDENSFEKSFKLQTNVLYKGEVSIVNGDFDFSFIVPHDISYNFDFGKISYYAKSANGDAWGCYQNLIVGGFDESAISDTEGPEIDVFLDDLSFMSGDKINTSPNLIALLADQHGINTVGTGIGHDIVMVLDGATDKSTVLNDYYTADLDSYNSGKINYSLADLSLGEHTLSIKAWDVYNNSSTSEVLFIISDDENAAIEHLVNFPNPFSNETFIQFEHGLGNNSLEIEIQILSFNGQLIKTISKIISISNSKSEPIRWDGDSDNGERLKSGIYIYRLKIKTADGQVFEERQKLVILR